MALLGVFAKGFAFFLSCFSMSSKRHLLRASLVVGFFSFLGSLTGIIVEVSIAAHLGLSRSSDTFYIAFTLPYIITNLISATGQFSLVPFFSSFRSDNAGENLWHGFSYALNLVVLGLAAIALLGAFFAHWIILGIAPGFTAVQSRASSELAHWLFFIIIPAGAAEICRSFLFSQHRFALGSAAGLIRNVVVIAFILLGFHRYQDFSIVMGYFAGYIAQGAILGAQVMVSFPARYTLTLRGAGKAFERLHGAGASQIAAALGWQGVVLVERVIASFLPPGTITALNYGVKIMTSLAELLSGSVGTGALPALSRAIIEKAVALERKVFQDAVEISLVLVSPIMVCCLVFPRPIMQLVFQRGQFSPAATRLMALIFFCYCLSLLLFSAVRLLNYYLFARHEMRSFLRLSGLYYSLTVALDILYVAVLHLGAKGIPLAFFTSLIVTGLAAWAENLAGIRSICDRALGKLVIKDVVAAVMAGAAMWRLSLWLRTPREGPALLLFLFVNCGIGCAVFTAVMAAWRAIPVSQAVEIWRRPENE